jgi:hypothetical protein
MLGRKMRGARAAAMLAAVLATASGCGVPEQPPTRALNGVAMLDEGGAILPQEAELVVLFRAADGSATVADRAVTQGRQPPLSFRLWVPADRGGRVDVAINLEGEPAWVGSPRVIGGGSLPIDLGVVMLARVAPAEPEVEPDV